jgi:hypothetical protein
VVLPDPIPTLKLPLVPGRAIVLPPVLRATVSLIHSQSILTMTQGFVKCLIVLSCLSLSTAWTAPPPKTGTHAYAKGCADDPNYDTSGARCKSTANPKALITSDPKNPAPQTGVRCHDYDPNTCKPWYWCEQYGRPMDVLLILDSSRSIGNKWQNLMKVVIAILEGFEEKVYPNVQCDTDFRSNGGTCKFRMGMQMWGRTNDNRQLCGMQNCVRVGSGSSAAWSCTEQKALFGYHCKVRANTRTLPCYYPDTVLNAENMVSGYTTPSTPHNDNGIMFDATLPNNFLPHMNGARSPNRAIADGK